MDIGLCQRKWKNSFQKRSGLPRSKISRTEPRLTGQGASRAPQRATRGKAGLPSSVSQVARPETK